MALFSFAFLGSEFFFDIRMGSFVSPGEVTLAQNIALGISALGFLSYAGVRKITSRKSRAALAFTGTAMTCACLAAVLMAPAPGATFAFGLAAFFILGTAGGAAHWAAARTLSGDTALSRTVGAGYAGGIALQFANNQFVPAGAAEVAALCLGCFALAALVLAAKSRTVGPLQPEEAESPAISPSQKVPHPKPAQPLKGAFCAVILVISLSCLFSTLDNVVTIANAEGTIAVEQWPRLLLAASGLAAGFLFDARSGAYRNIGMLCVAVLSVCSLLATEVGMGPLWGLIVFYLGSGFFVVFFTTTFLALAPRMRTPELWAGAGRAANNFCACLLSGLSLSLVQTGNIALIMVAALALIAVIAICFALVERAAKQSGAVEAAPPEAALPAESAEPATQPLSDEERLGAFARRYGITPREQDVLRAAMADERTLKQVADELGVSLRTVQKHLASIYQKTDTQTRAGLTKKYWE